MSEVSPEFGHTEYPSVRISPDILRLLEDQGSAGEVQGVIEPYEINLQETLQELGY